MPIIGFGTAFLGYSLLYYGITQLRGENWGLFDLVVPGRFAKAVAAGVPNDDPGSTTKPGAYGAGGGGTAMKPAPANLGAQAAAAAAAGL